MIDVEVNINGVEHVITFPGQWEGITNKQWRAALIIYSDDWSGGMEHMMHRALAELSMDEKVTKELLKQLELDEVCAIAEQLEWTQDVPRHRRSLLKRWGLFWGPNDFMMNCTVEQLGFVQQALAAIKNETNTDAVAVRKSLRMLMAISFRLFGLPFNNRLIKMNYWLMRCVPTSVLLLNVANVYAMLMELRETYEWAYDTTESEEGAPDHGYRALIEALSGEKFGTFYQVKKAKLHDVMVHLDLNAYRVAKQASNNNVTKNTTQED